MKHLYLFVTLIFTFHGTFGGSVSGTRSRIHGGEDASEGEFPYIISIRRIANAFKHMCAGVLIDPEWVLTTAFCVGEVGAYSVRICYNIYVQFTNHLTSSQIDAVGGEHNLIIPSSDEQIRGVDFIVRHPNYTHGDASVGGMAVSFTNSFS